jgi:hypothetical protein
MASLFELTSMFLVSDGWPIMRVEDTNTLHMTYQGENGIFVCLATALEESRTILYYSINPVEFAPEQYGDALEFVARANHGMINGCFEFDFMDGEVRYRTSLTLPDIDPTQACIRQIVYDAVTTMDLYLPGLQALSAGELSAIEAIDMVERNIGRTDI